MLSILRRMHLPKTPWPLHHSFRWSCFVHQPMVMLHSPRSIWGGITRRWCSMSFNYHVHDNLEVQYGAILMVQIIDVIFSHVAITSTGNYWVPRCMPATSWRCHWCSLAIPPSSFQQSPNSEACWSSYRSRMSYWPKWKPLPSWARSWSNTPAPGLYQAAATQHATHWLIDRCCRGKQKPTDADRMLGSHGHSFSYVGLLFPLLTTTSFCCVLCRNQIWGSFPKSHRSAYEDQNQGQDPANHRPRTAPCAFRTTPIGVRRAFATGNSFAASTASVGFPTCHTVN